jgi:hypothetical protein
MPYWNRLTMITCFNWKVQKRTGLLISSGPHLTRLEEHCFVKLGHLFSTSCKSQIRKVHGLTIAVERLTQTVSFTYPCCEGSYSRSLT